MRAAANRWVDMVAIFCFSYAGNYPCNAAAARISLKYDYVVEDHVKCYAFISSLGE
jgi:hypothetical protein